MKVNQAMESAPVKTLSLRMGLPVMLSMSLQALYNIVDSAFVANIEGVGQQATTALTLAFPIQMFITAMTIGTGIGAGVLMSRYLGEKEHEKANQTAGNTLFMGVVMTLICLVFGLFFTNAYISSQSTTQSVITMGVDYLRICCIFAWGQLFYGIYEKLLQSAGYTMYSTAAQILGAVINLVLDPILIYGFFGFQAMGVRGAAYATVIGQAGGALLGMFFFVRKCKEVDSSVRYMKPSLPIIKNIYKIGFPAIVAQGIMSIMTYSLNLIFVAIGESVVAAYGLFYKVQQLLMMLIFGLRDSTTPIIAYAQGMRNAKRVKEGVFYSTLYSGIIMMLGLIVLQSIAHPLANMFNLDGESRTYFLGAVRIISLSFVFAGLNIALQGAFQALNKGAYSLVISFSRQMIFVLPVAFIFTQMVISDPAKGNLIWWTFMIAEVVTLAMAAEMTRKTLKEVDQTLGE